MMKLSNLLLAVGLEYQPFTTVRQEQSFQRDSCPPVLFYSHLIDTRMRGFRLL